MLVAMLMAGCGGQTVASTPGRSGVETTGASPVPAPPASSPPAAAASAWPAEWRAGICEAEGLLLAAGDPTSPAARDAINQAFTAIDPLEGTWAPGELTRAALRAVFEVYSDAELQHSIGNETDALGLLVEEGLPKLQAYVNIRDSMNAGLGTAEACEAS